MYELILASPGGLHGAESRKASNILYNWKSLLQLTGSLAAVVTVAAGGMAPWALVVPALGAFATCNSLSSIKLDEHHARVIHAIWTLGGTSMAIQEEEILVCVNKEGKKWHRPSMTLKEMVHVLDSLKKYRVVKDFESGKWLLRERTRITVTS
jgi:hypothetical protein